MTRTLSHWPAESSESLVELTVGDLLRQAASSDPGKTALVARGGDGWRRTWSYEELLLEAERAALALGAIFEPGDHLAVWAPNSPEWVVLEFAAALAGLVLVTVNPALRQDEVQYVLAQSRADGLVMVDEYRGNPMREHLDHIRPHLPHLREVIRLANWGDITAGVSRGSLPTPSPADPVQIQYTSGTTGFPKGALLTHRGVVNNARLQSRRLTLGRDDVCLNYMPMFHTGGCVNGTLIPVATGATHVLMPQFDASEALSVMESEGCTCIGGVPTMYLAMMEHPTFERRDLSSVRVGWAGGATVSPDLVRSIQRSFGLQLSLVFGQTETSPTITQSRLDDSSVDKAESVGQPLPQTEVKIVDAVTGETVPVNVVGELCTRGYLTMLGYFDMPEATAEALDPEGWLHTGDLCRMDERGYVYVAGRIKDMIIRGGENIYPREVEEVFNEHPAIADTAVVGLPDAKWGELPVGFVRLLQGRGVSEDELIAYGRSRLAPHKVPRSWRFVSDFPTTPSGKIQKHVLRSLLEAESAGRSADAGMRGQPS